MNGEMEYQVNGEKEGNWQKGNEVSGLNVGDILYIKVNGTIQKMEIKDEKRPTDFEIEISSINARDITVNLKTPSTDEESGIKSYTFVVEMDGNKIEKTNITTSELKITGLKPTTSYKVYVIAYDNAGNSTKSNEIEITTTEEAEPTVSEPSTAGGYRAGNQLPFDWEQLADIAGIIANNASTITNNTSEFKLNYEGQDYTIGVGDWTTINGKKVRILGFNHDELVDKTVYGGTHSYAGISFEYVDFLLPKGTGMGWPVVNREFKGWAATTIRKTLNGDSYNEIKDITNIKKVKKAYCEDEKGTPVLYSEDYLWLLSCAEIWNNGYTIVSSDCKRGMSRAIEGVQYKFYKNINASAGRFNYYQKKPSQFVGSSSADSEAWFLRSVYYNDPGHFGTVAGNGAASYAVYNEPNTSIAPGFSI